MQTNWFLLQCPKPMQGHRGWRRAVKIHRTGPASPCAGDTDLGRVDILSLGEVGSRMGPRQFSALFQGLKADLLKTSPSLIPNPSSPSNLLTTVSALQAF